MGQIIKQTYRLYNTVGLIDKARNIYYVPHQDVLYGARDSEHNITKVSDVYYKLFNTVCPFSSKYNNIEFSQWSPEDRELKIEGLIDDFRQSRGLGLALNYIIIKRETYNVEGETETLVSSYFYAMFIDSVRQAGSRSVSLSLTPDYFTNFFYLNVEEELTEDYDPFNDSMVNTYVERQHYDRFESLYREHNTGFNPQVKSLQDDLVVGRFYKIDNTPRPTSNNLKVESLECYKNADIYTGIKITVLNPDNTVFEKFDCWRIYVYLKITNGYYKINYLLCFDYLRGKYYYLDNETYSDKTFLISINEDNLNFIYDTSTNPAGEYVLQNVLTKYLTLSYSPINQEKMLFNEESFRFKYQYRDKRIPLPMGLGDIDPDETYNMYLALKSITTKEEFNSYLSTITTSKSKKLLSILLLNFVTVQYKNPCFRPYSYSYYVGDTKHNVSIPVAGNSISKKGTIQSSLISIICPELDTNLFPNLDISWLKIGARVTLSDAYHSITENVTVKAGFKEGNPQSLSDFISPYLGGTMSVSPYLLAVLLNKYNPLINYFYDLDLPNTQDDLTTNPDTYRIIFDCQPLSSDTMITSSEDNYKSFYDSIKLSPYIVRGKPVVVALAGSEEIKGLSDNNIKLRSTFQVTLNQQGFSYLRAGDSLVSQNGAGFILGDYGYEEQSIELKEDLVELNKYIEPILESNPYKFYSISLYENEVPFKKERYYQSLSVESNGAIKYTVNARFVQSFNETYKVGVIPIYTVNTKTTLYFSEALVLTLPSSLVILTNEYYNFYYQNKAQMKNQYAVNDINYEYAHKEELNRWKGNLFKGLSGMGLGIGVGSSSQTLRGLGRSIDSGVDVVVNEANLVLEHAKTDEIISATQQAKLADMGAKPNTVKLAGSDVVYEASLGEMGIYLNHYTIDDLSYNTIAKILERTGYKVDIMDSLEVYSRVGLNYIKLVSFDFVEDNYVLSHEQMNAITEIFNAGVTLLHDKDYLHNLGESGYHNIEKALEQGGDN